MGTFTIEHFQEVGVVSMAYDEATAIRGGEYQHGGQHRSFFSTCLLPTG